MTSDGPPRRWRASPSWLAVLLAAILVAIVAAALAKPNADYYALWIYNDPQTSEEHYDQVMVDLFMAHTSGFFWGQLIALVLGAFLGSRPRGMFRSLAAAVPAGVLLAAVNVAVAWQLAAGSRLPAWWWAERGLPRIPTNLLADDRFQHVLGAGLAAFPIAAIAGVGLGTLIASLPRVPVVTLTLLVAVSTVSYGALAGTLGWLTATGDNESVAVFAVLALVPPSAVIPSVVRTALGGDGDAFTITMLLSSTTWALLLIIAGWLVRRRRMVGVTVDRGGQRPTPVPPAD